MQLPYRECHIGILKGDYFKLLEANKITSEIKGLGLWYIFTFLYRAFIHPVHKMVSVLQIIIYNHACNPLK